MRNRSSDDALGLGPTWPRPGWAVLDAARDQSFTGAIEFDTTPAVRVHLDRGRLYVAERVSDPPLGARLVDAGALTAAELEHGVIRFGDVEHLGRLFDRVPTVDRHRVMVLLELMTDEAARWVAAQLVRGVVVTPYEHHPSGVHRWAIDGEVVVPEVRGAPLPAPVPGTAHVLVPEPADVDELADEVRIEWADAAWMGSERADRRAVRSLPLTADAVGAELHRPVVADPEGVSDLVADVVPVDAPVDAGGPAALEDDVAVAFVAAAADEVVDGFEVIWPTGEVQREFPVPVVEAAPSVEHVPLTWNIRMPLPSTQPAADVVDELTEEVAAAVRRAIESITGGTGAPQEPAVLAEEPEPAGSEGPRIVRSSTLSDEEADAARRLAEPAIEAVARAAPVVVPAVETSSASGSPSTGSSIAPPPLGAPWLPDVRPAVVSAPVGEERKSALRRLISGLRRR